MGYMSQEHSPDAILSLRAYGPEAGKIAWTASVAWAAEVETMRDQELAGAGAARFVDGTGFSSYDF